ncbi:MAG: alpha/beta hydrolase [Cyanobacteria bacterium P01_F01_bin.150]
MPAIPVRKTVHTGTVELSYLEWNPANSNEQNHQSLGCPVLLLHGLADHAGVWQSLASVLASQHSVVAPDLRGHGNSSKPSDGYDCDQILADLTALMNHLEWESAHIIGHSWSAKLMCIWAHYNPERFDRLVLVDPAFTTKFPEWTRITFPLFYRLLPFLKMMGPFKSYENAENQAKALKQYKGWSEQQQRVFHDSIEQKPDGSWGSKFCVAARDGVFEDFTQVDGLTGIINVPTLLLRSTAGLNRSSAQLKGYKRRIPQLTIETIPGNHWVFLVEPDLVNRRVFDFLDDNSRGI